VKVHYRSYSAESPGFQGWRSFIMLVIKVECPCFRGRPVTASFQESDKYSPHIHVLLF